MKPPKPKALTLRVSATARVSALLQTPPHARACCLLAHGAGAGMTHPFLAALAAGLADRRIATLRFQFLYMEKGSRRPDPPALAHAVVRSAAREAARRFPNLPLLAGGKSFGGRMTSQAHAAAPLPGVQALVFFGFPLHPPDQPASTRAEHLFAIRVPMLFLQGTRDKLAALTLLKPLCRKLGRRATLRLLADVDHAFHVPARSGRTDAAVLTEMLDAVSTWLDAVVAPDASRVSPASPRRSLAPRPPA